jgi:hypothetical protein
MDKQELEKMFDEWLDASDRRNYIHDRPRWRTYTR